MQTGQNLWKNVNVILFWITHSGPENLKKNSWNERNQLNRIFLCVHGKYSKKIFFYSWNSFHNFCINTKRNFHTETVGEKTHEILLQFFYINIMEEKWLFKFKTISNLCTYLQMYKLYFDHSSYTSFYKFWPFSELAR